VVVTGYGMITPSKRYGRDIQECSTGRSGIGYLSSFDTKGLPCQIGGEVKDIWMDERPDLRHNVSINSLPGTQTDTVATLEAASRAQIDKIADRARIGVSLGYHADNPSIEDIVFLHKFYGTDGTWNMKDLLKRWIFVSQFLRRKPDVVTSILSILFHCKDLTSPSFCMRSRLQAIGEAYRIIRKGKRM